MSKLAVIGSWLSVSCMSITEKCSVGQRRRVGRSVGRLIESDVRYLVAHDDRPTTKERLDVRWAFAWVTMAVLLVALTFVDPIADGVRVPLRIVAFLAFLIGLSVIMRIRGSRSDRRWARLADAERAGIQPSSKPARDSQKLQPRTGKM
jgi:hypothetical protein